MKYIDSVVKSQCLKEILSLTSDFAYKKSCCDLVVGDILFISVCFNADATIFLKYNCKNSACFLGKENADDIQLFLD